METMRKALLVQGAYYVATGVAPFISRRGFEAVTGRKKEWWLVETVGVLVTAVGTGVAAAAARDRVTPEITTIAAGCAGGLAAIDIVHVARGHAAEQNAVHHSRIAVVEQPKRRSVARASGAYQRLVGRHFSNGLGGHSLTFHSHSPKVKEVSHRSAR